MLGAIMDCLVTGGIQNSRYTQYIFDMLSVIPTVEFILLGCGDIAPDHQESGPFLGGHFPPVGSHCCARSILKTLYLRLT